MIYMATPNQLRMWNNKKRKKECSSDNHFCKMIHLIPSDYFEDFTVLDTKYKFHDSNNNQCLSSFEIQRARLTLFETDTIQKRFVNKDDGMYNGVTLEVDEKKEKLMEATISNK